jgi:hypothetical protein
MPRIELWDYFGRPKGQPYKFRAVCPVHGETDRNLEIKYDNLRRKWILNCYSHGCDLVDIAAAAGFNPWDIYDDRDEPISPAIRRRPQHRTPQPAPQPEPPKAAPAPRGYDRLHVYRDAGGNAVHAVAVYPGKRVRPYTKSEDGTYYQAWLGDKYLYRLDEITNTTAPIFITEGEKDADTIAAHGYLATCSPFGAGKWHQVDATPLAGRDVIICADNDEPGRRHAEQVATSLHRIATRVRIVEFPDLPDKGDVTDFVEECGIDALLERAGNTPSWQPTATTPPATPSRTIAQRIEDTLGPNPCQAARFVNNDTGDEIGTVCDRKRCPDCGRRKQLTIKLQMEAGFGDLAYIGRTMSRGDIDRALETDKKKRQRGQVDDLAYQIVGDDSLGYVIVSSRPLIDEQRRMELREWTQRILDLYHRAGQRIRRSRILGRLGLVPNSHRRRRESGTSSTPWSWHNVKEMPMMLREWMLHEQNKERYGIVAILKSFGFSPDAIRPPQETSDPLAGRPVPY